MLDLPLLYINVKSMKTSSLRRVGSPCSWTLFSPVYVTKLCVCCVYLLLLVVSFYLWILNKSVLFRLHLLCHWSSLGLGKEGSHVSFVELLLRPSRESFSYGVKKNKKLNVGSITHISKICIFYIWDTLKSVFFSILKHSKGLRLRQLILSRTQKVPHPIQLSYLQDYIYLQLL